MNLRERLPRPDLLEPGAFSWALGIEDTFVPHPAARTGRVLDEYVLTQHDRFWREDLARIADVGVRHLRYGIPWYRVNPAPGQFDWSWTDEVLPYLVDLGVAPILDLIHYGAPLWLEGTFLAPDYASRVAEYAAAVAERYGRIIRYWTPLNEPTVHAYFAGRVGLWPPHRRGERSFAAVMVSLAEGVAETIDAIRAAAPDAVIVHVEAHNSFHMSDAELEPFITVRRGLPFLTADLVEGRVDEDHALRPWLSEVGIADARLDAFRERPRHIDIWGVNWYPQASHRTVVPSENGAHVARVRGTATELGAVVRHAHRRLDRPVMITETSVRGSVADRLRWLDAVAEMSNELREDGVPLVGVTWFPAFSLLSWDYRRGRRPAEAYLAHYGLWDLRPDGDGTLVRRTTPMAAAFSALIDRDSRDGTTDQPVGQEQPATRVL